MRFSYLPKYLFNKPSNALPCLASARLAIFKKPGLYGIYNGSSEEKDGDIDKVDHNSESTGIGVIQRRDQKQTQCNAQ